MQHQFPPFTLLLPQNSVSSSSPSCYNLEFSLVILVKLLSQKPLMTWLPSPVTSQSSSCTLSIAVILNLATNQKYKENTDARAPPTDSNLIGLGLAEGWVLA